MGNYRSTPDTTKHTVSGESERFIYAASGMCGWRLTMEDAHVALPEFSNKKFGLFAVFDGHGGDEVAKFAQKHLPGELERNPHYRQGNYEKALIETFLKVDSMLITAEGKKQLKEFQQQSVNNKQSEPEEESYAGCTANVCLITDTEIFVANAGDSRCIVVSRGKTENMSVDHKPDDEPELRRIKNAGGSVIDGRVNGNLNLSRALGDHEYKVTKNIKPEDQMISAKPDVKRRAIAGIELIVMGCDGVWQLKSNEQVGSLLHESIIKNGKPVKTSTEETLDQLIAPNHDGDNGLDNMTLITIQLKQK